MMAKKGKPKVPKIGAFYWHKKTGKLLKISSVFRYNIGGNEFEAAAGYCVDPDTREVLKRVFKGSANFCPRAAFRNLEAAA